jgi:hypothetical protein
MGLETGEFIDDLVQTNPITATDPVTEGSNHLQLIKKVLQQTFPGYDEAVTVTPAELNVLGDAALKGAANVFTELNTFDAGTMVPNNVAYRMMEFDGITPRFFAFIDPSDIMQFGNLNNDGVHTFKETLSFFRGATESFRGVVRSAGSLLVADTAGDLSPVAKTGAEETITAEWFHEQSIHMKNNVGLKGVNFAGDTSFNLVQMDENDLIEYGDVSLFSILRCSGLLIGVNGNTAGQFLDAADGTFTMADRAAAPGFKLGGFRNPTVLTITATNHTLIQGNEGQILLTASSVENYNIPTLEEFTTIRILNSKSGPITLTAVGTSLSLYNANGAREVATILNLEGGAVAEICYSDTTNARIFGNGLSVNT